MAWEALSLADRVAIVTGGAGGIGAATVQLMVARGAYVVVADRNIDGAVAVAAEAGPRAMALPLDLADAASVADMVERAAAWRVRLDILHNNAALLDPAIAPLDTNIEAMDVAVWDATFAVNVRGTMLACRAALPHLGRQGGAIVNTVSNLALQGHVIQAAYSASKAALIQLSSGDCTSHFGVVTVTCGAVISMFPATSQVTPPPISQLTSPPASQTASPRHYGRAQHLPPTPPDPAIAFS